jgi:hypothetical protein
MENTNQIEQPHTGPGDAYPPGYLEAVRDERPWVYPLIGGDYVVEFLGKFIRYHDGVEIPSNNEPKG